MTDILNSIELCDINYAGLLFNHRMDFYLDFLCLGFFGVEECVINIMINITT